MLHYHSWVTWCDIIHDNYYYSFYHITTSWACDCHWLISESGWFSPILPMPMISGSRKMEIRWLLPFKISIIYSATYPHVICMISGFTFVSVSHGFSFIFFLLYFYFIMHVFLSLLSEFFFHLQQCLTDNKNECPDPDLSSIN